MRMVAVTVSECVCVASYMHVFTLENYNYDRLIIPSIHSQSLIYIVPFSVT